MVWFKELQSSVSHGADFKMGRELTGCLLGAFEATVTVAASATAPEGRSSDGFSIRAGRTLEVAVPAAATATVHPPFRLKPQAV